MSKYFNPRLLNAVIAGTGMKHPVRPHVILGEQSNGFIRGDLMDANAIKEFIDQKISDLVNNAPEALDTLKELADAIEENGVADLVTKGQLEAALNTKADEEDLLDYVKKSDMSTMDASGHEYVEIGGIKWATMNIGANSVTDTGLYFAWGETQGYTADQIGNLSTGKKKFSWAEYKYGDGTSNPSAAGMTKYNSSDGKTTLDIEDDAAIANLGGSWRMPTAAEFQALCEAVNTEWMTDYLGSGMNGMLMTDKLDSSKVLFFPACGCYGNGENYTLNNIGFYMTSNVSEDDAKSCKVLFVNSAFINTQAGLLRYQATPVRAVLDGGDKYATKADLSNYVQKSSTTGLLKNDGTVDTNTYLTQHQDLSNYALASDLQALVARVEALEAYHTT